MRPTQCNASIVYATEFPADNRLDCMRFAKLISSQSVMAARWLTSYATHASIKKVVTCSRKMAILSKKDINNNNYFLKKPKNEKKQA
jgi:hypothetical protein